MDTPGASFVHQACTYGSDDEFLAMAVPFAEGGLAGGEPVVAVVTPRNIDLLRQATAGAGGVEYIDCFDWYITPGRTTVDYYNRVRDHTGPGRVRVIGEVVWEGRSEEEIAAWKRYESTLNVTFADTAAWVVCPYDTRALPPDVVADAQRTHPARLDGGDVRVCGDYLDPGDFVTGAQAVTLPTPPPEARLLPVVGEPDGARRFLATWGNAYGLTDERIREMAAAVHEAAGYLMRESGAHVSLWLWRRPGAVACRLHAPAIRTPDPFAGCRPPGLRPRPGDGLWLARYLCDRVEVCPEQSGCTVHLEVSGSVPVGSSVGAAA